MSTILRRRIGPLQSYQTKAICNPFTHFVLWGGVGVGKSYTLAHFAIDQIRQDPGGTGLIGANTHDQLSQATLRELFHWLTEYGYEFCMDTRPPKDWGRPREFKDYSNVLTVRDTVTRQATTILTRVLSNPDAIRGIELSWYGIDETRDTEEYAFDMILGRLRERIDVKGLITTTTNGEDWLYKRVLRNAGTGIYGAMHVPTMVAVKNGTISAQYYRQLLASYTELMILQELEAKHVNVAGGRAYYACGGYNRLGAAPWGDYDPSPDRPLIVGCDFNYSPAPCIWSIGQVGPEFWSPDNKVYYGDCIHWFGELVEKETSSPQMTMKLMTRYPGFFYRIYGDYSGNIGTTSNAGKTDYDQIGITLNDNGAVGYTIDCDQANPHVKDRVENVNGLLRNGLGETRMTYDPQRCPNLDSDLKVVGWKPSTLRGRGRLDDMGDDQRTHASDGVGYACWKIFPPGQRGIIPTPIPSSSIARISHVV